MGQQGVAAAGGARQRGCRSRIFRKDIILDFYNEAGQLAISYHIFRCWVSEYQALPDLDANANAVAIQHIKSRMRAGSENPRSCCTVTDRKSCGNNVVPLP
jgi:hypothetical protein